MKEIDSLNIGYFNNYYIKKYDDNNYELVFLKFDNSKKIKFNDLFISKDEELEIEKRKLLESKEYKEYKSFICSLARSRTKIFDYAMSNEFDYFVTLTLDRKKHDATDLELFIKNLGQFIRHYRRDYFKDIQYLLVPELHNDGVNWHMHGLIKGLDDEDLCLNKNGFLDWKKYSKKFGYISLSKIKSKMGVSKYITKYLTKDFNVYRKRKNKKMYYATRGLNTADKMIDGVCSINNRNKILEDDYYENNYIIKKELTKKELTDLLNSNLLVQN